MDCTGIFRTPVYRYVFGLRSQLMSRLTKPQTVAYSVCPALILSVYCSFARHCWRRIFFTDFSATKFYMTNSLQNQWKLTLFVQLHTFHKQDRPLIVEHDFASVHASLVSVARLGRPCKPTPLPTYARWHDKSTSLCSAPYSALISVLRGHFTNYLNLIYTLSTIVVNVERYRTTYY